MESLKFYWKITSRFRNWKVLYSNPSDTSSEDCKMTRPQEQQDVSASTVQESLDDTISGAKPLNERDPDNDWTKGEDSEEDDQHVFTSSKNQRGGRLFRSAQRGGKGGIKWEHPVAIAIMMVQDCMTISIYQKHQIALFVLKKIHEYDKPLLFGISNHKNFYNE